MLWHPSESDGARAFLAERADQGHKFFGPFRIALSVGLELVKADRWFQDHARWEAYLVPASFRLSVRCAISILSLDYSRRLFRNASS